MQTESIRKRVGKPTGETTKAGRPVYETETGERRSEYSSTIKLDNGKWINIPSIHNNKYYSDKELKEAVEDNRMIPTSEHDSEKEALEAAKKRSKSLNRGGITLKNYIKAHKGTLINGEIVYPDKKDTETKPFENPLIEPPKQISMPEGLEGITADENPFVKEEQKWPPKELTEPSVIPQHIKTDIKPFKPYYDPRVTTPGPGQILTPQIVNPFSKKMQGYVAPKQKLHQENMKGIKDQLDAGMINEAQAQQMRKAREKTFLDELNKDPEYVKLRNEFFKNQPKTKAVPIKSKETTSIKDYIKKLKEAKQKFNVAVEPQQQKQAIGQIPWHLVAQMQSGAKNKFNKGGAAMDQQMEMNFGSTPISELAEGGLKDEGGMTDKESGNKVPSGATRKEVRDDIPAMVSEGEFIFPADVTRYIGLDRLMELRQDAKMGLQKMEMMGQMGNSDEAVIPDDMPFDMDDVIVIDEKAIGGSIGGDEDVMDIDLNMAIGGSIGGDADVMNTDMSMQMAHGGFHAEDYETDPTKQATQFANKKVPFINSETGDIIYILISGYTNMPLEPNDVPEGYVRMGQEQKEEDIPTPTPDDDLEATQPVDDDDKPDPAKVAEQNRESAKLTADRLGFESVDDYLALSMKDRMKLIGEEFRIMGGGETDHNRVQGILDGSIDGGWDGSLFGGIFSTIGSIFDRDNDGSMWTSTDKNGYIRNIFGMVLNPDNPIDVSKMGILKDGRWTGASVAKKTNRNTSSGTDQSNELTSSLETPYSDTTRSREATTKEKQGAASRMKKKYTGPLTKEKGKDDLATRYGYDSSPGTTTGRQAMAQARVNRSKDQGDKGIAAETFTNEEKSRKRQTTTKDSFSTPEESERKKQGTTRKEKEDKGRMAGKGYTGGRGFASGTMVTKPKKKPTTQRKTLVKKKS